MTSNASIIASLKELQTQRLQASEQLKSHLSNMSEVAITPENFKEIQRLISDLEVFDDKIQAFFDSISFM